MNYKIPINDYQIGRGVDHHLIDGRTLQSHEGCIAVVLIKPGTDFDRYTEPHQESQVLFAHSEFDTATEKIWCVLSPGMGDEGEDLYTPFGKSPIDDPIVPWSSIITITNPYYSSWGNYVYFVGAENKSYIELENLNHPEHVFVESASLTAAEKDQLDRLTDMDGAERLSELLEEEWKNLATIALTNGGNVLDVTGERENPFTTTIVDPTLQSKIIDWGYDIRTTCVDGTLAPFQCTVVTESETGCVVKVPPTYVSGTYKVKVSYWWKTKGENYKHTTSQIVTLSSWDDPIILTETIGAYNTLNGYGMILDPRTADAANFGDTTNLTSAQMSSATAVHVLVKAGLLTATSKKVDYLMEMGMSNDDAVALAKKFMCLSEAKAVTAASMGTIFKETLINSDSTDQGSYNPTISTAGSPEALTHFESFGYFVNVKEAVSDAFRYCTQLTTIFLPLSTTAIADAMFSDCVSLSTVKSLKG